MKLFDSTLSALSHALDARLRRQNVLQSNLANADTPGYQAKQLDFDRAMAQAQAEEQQAAAPPLAAAPLAEGELPLGAAPAPATPELSQAQPGAQGPVGLDGNGVDLDRTMVELAQNGLLYGAAAKTAQKKLAILKFVASDGAA